MNDFELSEIEKIETKGIVKNINWYYHGFEFSKIALITEKGILAKKYQNPSWKGGNNGPHYISVAKDIDITHIDSALSDQMNEGPLIIIDENIDAIKCKKIRLYRRFKNSSLPLRYSCYIDEYQVFEKVLPDKFVGVECSLYNWVRMDNIRMLKGFRIMIEIMQSLNIQLPIYDFSRQEDNIVHELNKDEFLELSKHLINRE